MRNDDYQEERRVRPYTIMVEGNVATEAYRRARLSAYEQQENISRTLAESGRGHYIKEEPQEEVKEQRSAKKDKKKAKKKKTAKADGVYTARKPILFILAVLMIVAIVVNILPIVGLVPEYTSAFMSKSQDSEVKDLVGRPIADPVMSLVSFLGGDPAAEWAEDDFISQSFFRDCFTKVMKAEDAAEDEKIDTTKLICFLAMPVLIILFAVTAVYIAIKFLLAAIKGKKYKFGFALLTCILYLVGIAVLTVVWNSFGIGEILGVFTAGLSAFGIGSAATKAALGLGFYITAVIILLAFILNIFAYKKEKTAKSKK